MKDFDWRKRYAPHGYAYVKRQIDFKTLERARVPRNFVEYAIEEMLAKIARDCPYFYDPQLAHTRVSLYPKEIGERLNSLDPLKPRFGIEIEIRQPMPKDKDVKK